MFLVIYNFCFACERARSFLFRMLVFVFTTVVLRVNLPTGTLFCEKYNLLVLATFVLHVRVSAGAFFVLKNIILCIYKLCFACERARRGIFVYEKCILLYLQLLFACEHACSFVCCFFVKICIFGIYHLCLRVSVPAQAFFG